MNPMHTPSIPIDRTRKLLSLCLAVALTAPIGFSQSTDPAAMRRLQDENAALRKQLAEYQAHAAPATTTTVVQPASPAGRTGQTAPTPTLPIAAPHAGVHAR